MDRFLETMFRLPMDVLISSMESMTRTMHEIQERAETQSGEDRTDDSVLGNAPRLALTPLFEMYKVPASGIVSGFDTLSRAMEEARKPPAADRDEDRPPRELDDEVVELDAGEAEAEEQALIPGGVAAVRGPVVWQVGRAGRADFPGKWSERFDYRVGQDLDPVDAPRLPHLLAVHGGPTPAGGTARMNLHFALPREFGAGELALCYDRWGAEKDRIFLDDRLLAPVQGAGRGRLRQVALDLGVLAAGEHVLSCTTSGETTDRAHRIDCFRLRLVGADAEV